MIPLSFEAFYAFLGLVAPGLVFEILRERRRPALEEATFRQVSRIAVSSLGFSTLSLLLMGFGSLPMRSLVPDVPAWITYGNKYLSGHFWTITLAIILEVTLASGLAVFISMCLHDHGFRWPSTDIFRGPPVIEKTSIWYQIFHSERPRDRATWACAQLSNDMRIWGYVHLYTVGQNLEQREILFAQPGLAWQEKDKEINKLDKEEWDYIIVKASDIVMMKISYRPTTGKDANAPRRGEQPTELIKADRPEIQSGEQGAKAALRKAALRRAGAGGSRGARGWDARQPTRTARDAG